MNMTKEDMQALGETLNEMLDAKLLRMEERLESRVESLLNARFQHQARKIEFFTDLLLDKKLKTLKEDVTALGEDNTQLDAKIEKLETRMVERFDFLELCINEAAKDAGNVNIRLREHIEQPVHSL